MSNAVVAPLAPGAGSAAPAAPPVVAVVVVHQPGEWFAETVDSLARQDYPNLSTLFLLAGSAVDAEGADLRQAIHAVLPEAFVELVDANPGYGLVANLVLEVVDGDTGFFCLCHDDVALAPAAIRLMTEELYRSNAGIVGPKLVTWDNPNVLSDVGLDVDRFGAAISRVEPGDYDQQQHDVVAEVFAVPSACLLVRADLFRSLGGFDETMRYYGEDVDLCWRARISGARVVVAPSARVRHRNELELRRPDLGHESSAARSRVRSTVTLTPGRQLPVRLLQLVGITLVELVVAPFTGRAASGFASLRALVGALARFPTLLTRRGAIARQRAGAGDGTDLADDSHSPGSAQLTRLRSQGEMRTLIGIEDNIRRWRESSLAPTIAWVLVVVAVVMASRELIRGGFPVIGEFLRLPDSAGDLWSEYRSGWNRRGLGATSANPTGLAALAVASVGWLFSMGAGLTVLVVALVLLGGLGVWRLADVFPSNRERIVALVVYVATPLLPAMISTGRLGALVTYAALPWFVQLLRRSVGIATADPASEDADLPDGVLELTWHERARRVAVAAVVLAFASALAPQLWFVAAVATVLVVVATLVVGSDRRLGAWMFASGAAALAVAWVLNLPSSTAWSLDRLAAPPLAGPPGRGIAELAAFDIGVSRLSVLSLVLYLPVVIALLISRAWRLSWAARGAALVVGFGALAVLQDRGTLDIALPDVAFLLVPVVLGLALAAAVAVASFGSDVAGRTFGWRQPVGLAAIAAVLAGIVPSALTIIDGRWYAPTTTMAQLVGNELQSTSDVRDTGDQRVLYLGDPRLVPGAATDIGGGVAMLVTDPGVPTIGDRWAPTDGPATDSLRQALGEIAAGRTRNGGRLLAPFGIRYVVVPVYDGAVSTPEHPLELPAGLLGALQGQLDLELRWTTPHYRLFVNRSSFPVAGLLTGAAAEATRGDSILAAGQPGITSEAQFERVLADQTGDGQVAPGVVHLAVPASDDWTLQIAGAAEPLESRPSFGTLTAFDVAETAPATLRFVEPSSRSVALGVQGVLWVLVLVAASRARVPRLLGRRKVHTEGGEQAVLDLAALAGAPMPADDQTAPLFRPEPAVSAPTRRRGLFDDDATGDPFADVFGADASPPDATAPSESQSTAAATSPTAAAPSAAPSATWVDDLFDDDDGETR